MLAAMLAFIPPARPGGDEATVQRIIKRPNNALEAAGRAPMELAYGIWDAGTGMLFDPLAVSVVAAAAAAATAAAAAAKN